MLDVKYQVNVPRLKGLIAEHGHSVASLAREIGISRNTLTQYLKEPQRMSYQTISSIITVLLLSAEDAQIVFFDDKLTQTQERGRHEQACHI